MKAKRKRYHVKWREKTMASARADILSLPRAGRVSKKLRSVSETVKAMTDRNLVKLLREARRDIEEGKTTPLRSLRK